MRCSKCYADRDENELTPSDTDGVRVCLDNRSCDIVFGNFATVLSMLGVLRSELEKAQHKVDEVSKYLGDICVTETRRSEYGQAISLVVTATQTVTEFIDVLQSTMRQCSSGVRRRISCTDFATTDK